MLRLDETAEVNTRGSGQARSVTPKAPRLWTGESVCSICNDPVGRLSQETRGQLLNHCEPSLWFSGRCCRSAESNCGMPTSSRRARLLSLPAQETARRSNTSPSDFAPIEQLQLMRFNGKSWELFGPIMNEHASS